MQPLNLCQTQSFQRFLIYCSKSLAITAALLVSQASFAYQFHNLAGSSAGTNAIGAGDREDDSYVGTVITPVTATATIDYINGPAFANQRSTSTANAVLGAVHASSAAISNVASPTGFLNASGLTSALSEYNDIFVINSGGFAAGTIATLTATVLLHGDDGGGGSPNMPYAGNGQAWAGHYFWRSTVRIGNYFWENNVQGNGASWIPNIQISGDGTFGLLTLITQITLGQNTSFALRAETEAGSQATTLGGAFSSAQSSFSSDLSSALSWQGITSLTVNGQAISDFTALSASSGFDFSKSYDHQVSNVPLPETYAMMLAGLGFLGIIARRRKCTQMLC